MLQRDVVFVGLVARGIISFNAREEFLVECLFPIALFLCLPVLQFCVSRTTYFTLKTVCGAWLA